MGGIVDIKHDLAFEHAFGRLHVDGTDIDLGIVVDLFQYVLGHARAVEAVDRNPGQESDALVLLPFGLDNPVAVLGHQLDSLGTVGPVYFDTLVRNDDANHVIARNRVAAFGNDVVELLDIVAQQEAFGLVFHLRLDGILQVERVALRLRRVLGLVAGTAPTEHLPEPVLVLLFLRFEDRLDILFLYLVHGHVVEELRLVLAREGILYRPDVLFGKRHGKGGQYLLQGIAALVIVTGVFLAQPLAYLGLGAGGNHIVEPGLVRLLGLGSDDFHLVAVLEFLVDGHQFVVHFGSNHGETDFGMDMEGKVEHGGTRRQALDLACRRIDIDFAVEEVLPEVVQETQRIVRSGMLQHLLDFVQPEV